MWDVAQWMKDQGSAQGCHWQAGGDRAILPNVTGPLTFSSRQCNYHLTAHEKKTPPQSIQCIADLFLLNVSKGGLENDSHRDFQGSFEAT